MKSKDLWIYKGMGFLILVVVLGITLIVGFFVYKFGGQNSLSEDPANWGQLGDYVGGLLNPFFSLFAFLGVCITIHLQAKQLDIVRRQAELEELQRALAWISEKIDDLLDRIPDARFAASQFGNTTIFNALATLGEKSLDTEEGKQANWLGEHGSAAIIHNLKNIFKSEFNHLLRHFESLGWILEKYLNNHGSTTVLEFYIYRYQAMIMWMIAADLAKKEGKLSEIFRIEALKAERFNKS